MQLRYLFLLLVAAVLLPSQLMAQDPDRTQDPIFQVTFPEDEVLAYSGTQHSPLGASFYRVPMNGFGFKVDARTFVEKRPEPTGRELLEGIGVVFLPDQDPTLPTESIDVTTESYTRTVTAGLTKFLTGRRNGVDAAGYRINGFVETGLSWSQNYQVGTVSGEKYVRKHEGGHNTFHPVLGTGLIFSYRAHFSGHVGYDVIIGKVTDNRHEFQFGIGYRF